MNSGFIKLLEGLSNPRKEEAVKLIMARFRETSAGNKNLYSDNEALKRVRNSLFDSLDTHDEFLEFLIKLESASAYSIFKFILDDDYSDILIYHNGMHLSNNREGEDWKVPSDLYRIYNIFIDHFVSQVMFLSQQKLDTGNNTLDAEIQGMRFNITHGSVIASNRPVLAIRKNLAKETFKLDASYINSIGATPEQIQCIHKYAFEGNYIIFGQVGSGKAVHENQKLTVFRKKQ